MVGIAIILPYNDNKRLFFVGLGLNGLKSCTLEGLKVFEIVDRILIEGYTNSIEMTIPKEFDRFRDKIEFITRKNLEEEDYKLINSLKEEKIAIAVSGDPFIATTHITLRLLAEKNGFEVVIIHNASILSVAASYSGLSAYKFGRTVTVPFPENRSHYPYDVIGKNKKINAHTLVLLDINVKDGIFLSINQAIESLIALEEERQEEVFTEDSLIFGLCKLGQKDAKVVVGNPTELKNLPWSEWGFPQAMIVCADELDVVEEETINSLWKNNK